MMHTYIFLYITTELCELFVLFTSRWRNIFTQNYFFWRNMSVLSYRGRYAKGGYEKVMLCERRLAEGNVLFAVIIFVPSHGWR